MAELTLPVACCDSLARAASARTVKITALLAGDRELSNSGCTKIGKSSGIPQISQHRHKRKQQQIKVEQKDKNVK